MAIQRSQKTRNMRYALEWAADAVENIDDVKSSLESHITSWGGDPEQPEYKLAMESLEVVMAKMEIVHENVRELARMARREDLARAKAEATE